MSWQWSTQNAGSAGVTGWPASAVPSTPAASGVNAAATSYTPEQWAAMNAMQQQNWQQWMTWQQQYQQWQQQYGEQYAKQMGLSGQAAQTPFSTIMSHVQPPLPADLNVVPPPLPQETKPPLPPDDPPVNFNASVPPPQSNLMQSGPPFKNSNNNNQWQGHQQKQQQQQQQSQNNNNARNNPGANRNLNQSSFSLNSDNSNSVGDKNYNKFSGGGNNNNNNNRFNKNQQPPSLFDIKPFEHSQFNTNFPSDNNNKSDFGSKRSGDFMDNHDNKRNRWEQEQGGRPWQTSRWGSNNNNNSGSSNNSGGNSNNNNNSSNSGSNNNNNQSGANNSRNQSWSLNQTGKSSKPNPDELSEAEKQFDKQFEQWEAQFNKWKEQNRSHPDKQQYKEYEAKWESWRAQLLDRREQMRRKRMGLPVNSLNTPVKPPIFGPSSTITTTSTTTTTTITSSSAPDTNNLTSESSPKYSSGGDQNNPAKLFAIDQGLPKFANNEKSLEKESLEKTTDDKVTSEKDDSKSDLSFLFAEPPKEQRINARTRKLSNAKQQQQQQQQDDTSAKDVIDLTDSAPMDASFLSTASASKSIPGLDFTDDDHHQQQQQQQQSLPPPKIEENVNEEKPDASVKLPNLAALSAGINTILGDEKLMNMLSMVAKNTPSTSSGTDVSSGQQQQQQQQQLQQPPLVNKPVIVPSEDTNQSFQSHDSASNQYFADGKYFEQDQSRDNMDSSASFRNEQSESFDRNLDVDQRINNGSNFNSYVLPPPFSNDRDNFNFDDRGGPNAFNQSVGGPNDFVRGGSGDFNRGGPPNDFNRDQGNFGQRGPNDFDDNRTSNDFNRGPRDFNVGGGVGGGVGPLPPPSLSSNDFNKGAPGDFNRGPPPPPAQNDFNRCGPNNFNRGPNNDPFNRGPDDFNRGPNSFNRGPPPANDFNRGPDNFNRGPDDFNSGPNNFNRVVGPNDFNHQFNRGGPPNNRGGLPNDFNRGPPPLNDFNQGGPMNDFNRGPGNNFTRGCPPPMNEFNRGGPPGGPPNNFNNNNNNNNNRGGPMNDFNRGPLNDFNRGMNDFNFGRDFNERLGGNWGLGEFQPQGPINNNNNNNNNNMNRDMPPRGLMTGPRGVDFLAGLNGPPPNNCNGPWLNNDFPPPGLNDQRDLGSRGVGTGSGSGPNLMGPSDFDNFNRLNADQFNRDDFNKTKNPTYWDEALILKPFTVIDYGHKSLNKPESTFLEPVQTFDYNHASKMNDKDKQKIIEPQKSYKESVPSSPAAPLVSASYSSSSSSTSKYDRYPPPPTTAAAAASSSLSDYSYKTTYRNSSNYERIDRNRSPFDNRNSPNYYTKKFDHKNNRSPVDKFTTSRYNNSSDKHSSAGHYNSNSNKYNSNSGSNSKFSNLEYEDIEDEDPFDNDEFDSDKNVDRDLEMDKFANKSSAAAGTGADKNNASTDDSKTTKIIMVEDLLIPPGRNVRPQRIVIILRGPPGSGKTFLAKLIKDKEVEQGGSAPRILSLDDYFMVETDKEVVEKDTGRKTTVKEMVYEYEECMELSYRQSLEKAFKKTITDGFFPFIILDCINDKTKYFSDMWSFAKQNGFQVYICQMEMDVSTCTKRNVHHRSEIEIERLVAGWEATPAHYLTLDASSLIQSGSIAEVEMEEVSEAGDDDQDDEETEGHIISKWERMEHSYDKLAKLDGISKPLRPKTMEDYLQLDDDEIIPEDKPGIKRVRWADLEERRHQEKIRALGFVVGQTDWNRMLDPTQGGSALTQTKYIERVRRFKN